MRRRFAALLSLCLMAPPLPAAAAAPAPSFATLAPRSHLHGFRAVARYQDASRHPMGARFVHERTGFTLDVLQIQSVPQAFMWVNTWPTSDMGEPHTQEHLLLGKGNRGRTVATVEAMSLAEDTAYTEQRRTCYQFSTSAGPDVFYDLLERSLGALLHPDYTDEEIRREVRNFGLAQDAKGLRLEEQGTVYNEMVSTYEQPWTRLYRQLQLDLYGPNHPLSYESGGSPDGLRKLAPAQIRAFHHAHYHLANMGMIASLPKEMTLDAALAKFDAALNRIEPNAHAFVGTFKTDKDLPPPHGVAAGTVRVVGYPDESASDAGEIMLGWPAATRFKDARDRYLAALFASAVAGDATTNLYKRFIDSKTRQLDIGATGVYAGFDEDEGHPFSVSFSDVASSHLNPKELAGIRDQVRAELAHVAALPAGSKELIAFNERVRSLVTGWRRSTIKFVNSPPGFGFRGTSSAWLTHLDHLNEAPGFDKAVTLGPDIDAIEALLKKPGNVWKDRLAAWGVLGASPVVIGVKPDPALVKREDEARKQRLAAETARLVARYHAKSDQEALQRYQADYAAHTAELKRLEASAAHPFLAHPPMTRDPDLEYRVTHVAKGIPLVASTFDNMTGATTTLALRLDAVPPSQLVYLPMLPTLLTDAGVIVDGKPLSYEETTKRLRNEILSLGASFARNPRTHRAELVLSGAGNTPAESERALTWMQRVAYAPDWRPENLPRLRDLVDQGAASLRQTMKGSAESWVNDPASAYHHQDDPLQLVTGSFLTMEHDAHRLRWRLREPGGAEDFAPTTTFVAHLAGAATYRNRQQLAALLDKLTGESAKAGAFQPAIHDELDFPSALAHLPKRARANVVEMAKDLSAYLPDLPDDALAKDWAYLCQEMLDDLAMRPEEALKQLTAVRQLVLNAPRARMTLVGARATQDRLLKHGIPQLAAGLDVTAHPTQAYDASGVVTKRLRTREPNARPVFVGLVDPNTQSGVFVNAAPGASYRDTDANALEDYLASKLYGGGGAHSIFMKTWAAGLAYSNGIGSSADSGELHYYAERCPALPQTLGFVIGELKKAKEDPGLVEYAYAQAFDDMRASSSYEGRGQAMAADLVDGTTPELVKRFRQGLLGLRHDGKLADELFKRMPAVYGRVLPGLDGKPVAGGSYFVIGPDKQLDAYEKYLQGAEGADTKLYRLYPRDFWMTE